MTFHDILETAARYAPWAKISIGLSLAVIAGVGFIAFPGWPKKPEPPVTTVNHIDNSTHVSGSGNVVGNKGPVASGSGAQAVQHNHYHTGPDAAALVAKMRELEKNNPDKLSDKYARGYQIFGRPKGRESWVPYRKEDRIEIDWDHVRYEVLPDRESVILTMDILKADFGLAITLSGKMNIELPLQKGAIAMAMPFETPDGCAYVEVLDPDIPVLVIGGTTTPLGQPGFFVEPIGPDTK